MPTKYLAEVPPLSWSQIEALTRRIQRVYAPQVLESPIPFPIEDLVMFDMYEHTGAVFRVEDPDLRIEGVTRYDPEWDRLNLVLSERTVDALESGNRRARMTAAHEFGHVCLHEKQIRIVGGSDPIPSGFFRKKAEVPPYMNPERQAEVFAGRLLVPAQSLRTAIDIYGPNPDALADIFQVSRSGMMVRMREIGALE